MLRLALLATQQALLEFCQPAGGAFAGRAQASAVYTIMMLS